MKKQLYILILSSILLISLLFPSYTFAMEVDKENITTPVELHNLLIENKLVSLSKNGQILFKENKVAKLNISEELYTKYKKDLEKLNQGVEQGLMYFDSTLQVKTYSPEKIKEKVFLESLKNPEEKFIEESDLGSITPMSIEPPLNVKNLVIANREELENTYDIFWTAQQYGGGDAYTATVGWWVGKIMPGGSWDYKVVPGYAPWYKVFYGTFFDGKYYINSAYIGNYNYGYTGEFLFSKSVLLAAGDGVSIITTFMDNIQKGEFKASLDGEDDKIPVRKGYDDAVSYD